MRKTTLYIPDLLHESLRAASRRSGPPQAEIVREALEAYLEAKGPPALESLDAERYRDIPLGFADAAVIAGADRRGGAVLTLDMRHFSVVARERRIRVVPGWRTSHRCVDRDAALHESARNGRVVGEVDVYVRRKHVVDGVASRPPPRSAIRYAARSGGAGAPRTE